jgi:hypothetical protein
MASISYERIVDPALPSLPSLLRFDATLSEVVSLASSVTEHPMESGAPLSDHVRHANITVSLEVMVSNTPLDNISLTSSRLLAAQLPLSIATTRKKLVTYAQVTGGFVQPFNVNGFPRRIAPISTRAAVWAEVPEFVGGRSLQFGSYVDRVGEVYSALVAIKQKAMLCTVFGKEKTFTSMILTAMSAPTAAQDSMTFSLTFTGTRFADVAQTIEAKRRPLEPRAKAPVDAGPTAKSEAEDFSGLNAQAEQSVAQALGELAIDAVVQ